MLVAEFLRVFYSLATQLRTPEIAAQWVAVARQNSAITAEAAAGWANLGYMPGEAERAMAAGVTLRMAEHAANLQRARIWRNGKQVA